MKSITKLTEDRKLLSLFLSCPLNEPLENCILKEIRLKPLSEIKKTVKSIQEPSLKIIIEKHESCFNNRLNTLHSKISPDKNPDTYLKWISKVNIGLLTYELKKRKWIKSQNEFAKLFKIKPSNDYKVHWDLSKEEELAFLLHELKRKNFFIIKGSKGFFKYIECHIVGFNEETLKMNHLKKICSEIVTDEKKHSNVKNEIDNIVRHLVKYNKD